MRFLMKKTSFSYDSYALVSAGEPRGNALPVRYEVPEEWNPALGCHWVALYKLGPKKPGLIIRKRVDSSASQGFFDIDFSPEIDQSYRLVYGIDVEPQENVVATFNFSILPASTEAC